MLSSVCISIHALAKRATQQIKRINKRLEISIHALAKRATLKKYSQMMRLLFQSTPSQRGRRSLFVVSVFGMPFQSTPSQRGRRDFFMRIYNACCISIHALAKRATFIYIVVSLPIYISIHALAKRATANLYNDYLYFEAKYHISDIFPL